VASKRPTDKPLPPKLRKALLEQIGVNEFPDLFLRPLHDAQRTGRRHVPEDEVAPYHCSSEWHFARFMGDGARVAPLVYGIMFHLGSKSNDAFPSIQKLARYFNVNDDYLYAAVNLLVIAGFLEVLESEQGKTVHYRPVGHEEWAGKHPGFCVHKDELYFSKGDELGRALYGILGGEKYHPNILKGLRNTGVTDAGIKLAAVQFMKTDHGNGGGKDRRKRFQAYLREHAVSFKSDGPE
jgi:hypothetical protein